MLLDAGPDSAKAVVEKLAAMKTLVWNGPLGAFELAPFDTATVAMAKEAARLTLPGTGATGWDLVLIGRDGTGRRDFATLIADLRGALRQAGVTP